MLDMCVQFRGTGEGKTVLEYWSYEVDPLTTMSKEAFTKFIGGFLSQKLVAGMEAKAKSLATKWTGGLKPMTLDAPVEIVWDLSADWANWQQFVPSQPDFPLVAELIEGENRKLGCVRHADLAPDVWTEERLIAIDNVSHYFSYNMEKNMFAGGIQGYINRVQVTTISILTFNPLESMYASSSREVVILSMWVWMCSLKVRKMARRC